MDKNPSTPLTTLGELQKVRAPLWCALWLQFPVSRHMFDAASHQLSLSQHVLGARTLSHLFCIETDLRKRPSEQQ